MNQDADQLTFVMDNVDTLLVAGYHGASMDGTIANPRRFGFLGPNFMARRRAGTTDPNEGPAFVDVQSASDHLAAGDSLLVSGRVLNGYGDAPDDQTFKVLIRCRDRHRRVPTARPVRGARPGTRVAAGHGVHQRHGR
jgi:hypothetical protein